jgi:DNA-binding response OmpR family regulator
MENDLVLMVDDELDNRVMMRYFLESWGYEVELAANGQEALKKVAERRPALVLLDLEMPVMDGFETCHRLKEDPKTESIPVIMFTGLESTSDKVKGIRRGADDYVVKTVDPEEIQARIEMILRRTRRYEAPPASDNDNGADAVISGSLDEKSFPEAFQLALAYGQSGTLVLKNAGLEARVYLNDGNVVHAEAGELGGEDAFYELALWSQGQFHYIVGEVTAEVTIRKSGTSLLMEATRRMDEWNLISTKIPSFDVVPHRVATSGQEAIRLTRIDWKVASLVDGRKTIRGIAEELASDLYDVGRAVFGLITAGALSFDSDKNERDSFFDAVPELRPDPRGEEPYELSAVQWKLLASIDGKRDLGVLTHLVGLAPRKMAECLKDLAERGFIRVNKPRAQAAIAAATATAAGAPRDHSLNRDMGKVEAFTPRIRAIGFD